MRHPERRTWGVLGIRNSSIFAKGEMREVHFPLWKNGSEVCMFFLLLLVINGICLFFKR